MPYAQMNPTEYPYNWYLTVHDDGEVLTRLGTLTVDLERGETFAAAEPLLADAGWQPPNGWSHWIGKGAAYTATVVR